MYTFHQSSSPESEGCLWTLGLALTVQCHSEGSRLISLCRHWNGGRVSAPLLHHPDEHKLTLQVGIVSLHRVLGASLKALGAQPTLLLIYARPTFGSFRMKLSLGILSPPSSICLSEGSPAARNRAGRNLLACLSRTCNTQLHCGPCSPGQ